MELLKKIYYDPSHPASFSTVEKLYEAVKRKIKKKKILTWLQEQRAYTLHKPKRKRFLRNFYDIDNIDDLWESDLIDFQSLSQYNNGVKFILVVIDVFSKFAWTVPLKNKTSGEIVKAFDKIFKFTTRRPIRIQTDKGREYNNKKFIAYLKKFNVKYNTTRNEETKACIAERFIRTIKTLIYKYLTSMNSLRYIDVLEKITNSYNKRKHSSIGIEPCNVTEDNILFVYNNLNRKRITNNKKPVCNVGDNVRISLNKHIFSKGYEPNWSEEIFKIDKVILRDPIVYCLKDLAEEAIEGVFYEKEVQKVIINENTNYLVDKILRTRFQNGIREAFVKWRGYANKFNSWIAFSEIKK
jgi:hypothetical protein